MATFQPPPTFADPVITNEHTNKGQFNPIWLKWFLDLAQYINSNGGSTGTQNHNSLAGLQGGATGSYFHLTSNAYSVLGSISPPASGSIMYGAGGTFTGSTVGATGQVLTSGGTGAPSWSNVATTTGSSILYGNGSGGFSNVTIGSNLTFSGGTLSVTPILGSGVYTPTIANTVNVASSTAKTCNWERNGSTVTVSGSVSITPTANTTVTKFTVSLPVASNFSLDSDCVGYAGGMVVSTTSMYPPYTHANTTAKLAEIVFTSGNNTANTVYFHFTYTVK